ncbi:MAG: peptide ABC transporter permease [Desulfobacteraceae bacterium]|nr:peptide ABC transporter permease [Desulfobacteraceae bacterium]
MTSTDRTAAAGPSPRFLPSLVWFPVVLLLASIFLSFEPAAADGQTSTADEQSAFTEALRTLGASEDRSFGSPGAAGAAAYIREQFEALGFDTVESQRFAEPALRHRASSLIFSDTGVSVRIHPLFGNAIAPEAIAPPGLSGPVYYVGDGRTDRFNGKPLDGSILLMEMDSGKRWQQAANLGAKAVIYVDRGPSVKAFFQEKVELTPLKFPRFWISLEEARRWFGSFETVGSRPVYDGVRLVSDIRWKETTAENVYVLVPGTDPELSERLIIVEAFYDSSASVFGLSPGADEACSAASLLSLARYLKSHPPARSVLLLATAGHSQALAGMRQAMWALKVRTRDLRDLGKALEARQEQSERILAGLEGTDFSRQPVRLPEDPELRELLRAALEDQIKTEADALSRRLMRLRLSGEVERQRQTVQKLADERLLLRRMGWRSDFQDLTEAERKRYALLVSPTRQRHRDIVEDARNQLERIQTAKRFRSRVRLMELDAVISLHLSSHGNGFGAFHQGWLYTLKSSVNRVAAYSLMDDVLRKEAERVKSEEGLPPLFHDTLRPSRKRSWESYFADHPHLGGEVSALAGFHGITFATTDDARLFWGTPYDRLSRVDLDQAFAQSRFVTRLVHRLSLAPQLHGDIYPRDGFSAVDGRANFLRHGELFPDQPAPGSMILAYQDRTRFLSMVDSMGAFHLRGVADKKHVLHKVIIEGYRFDPDTGDAVWAIDKKQTGINAYRVKMNRNFMETDLVMFGCRRTTIFNLLEPRNLHYMPKIRLLDGRREATPLRYWWSRTDTWSSTIASIFLEPGTPLKMTLSDTVLRNKLILTNATEEYPNGVGYRIDEWPTINPTEYRVARDMWMLIRPRVENLEHHGIHNEQIRNLQKEGTRALDAAERALAKRRYDVFLENARKSWALATRVYEHVEKTQKDVLFGVLFYIALFVPFAFCLERFLFSYASIYKRIIAFCVILVATIAVVYQVHPAFELAYSPMVVVLAFFIMGLSLIVTLIIFFRFETEMTHLQRRAGGMETGEISRWKAFSASFFLGVSNLRRRRVRTVLTCLTLLILTFTIMSFTSVKSVQLHNRLALKEDASYQGLLLKRANWEDLPPESMGIVRNAFEKQGTAVPRVWLEEMDRTRTPTISIQRGDLGFEARGMIGFSEWEPEVTGLDRFLVGGRWFRDTDRRVVILSDRAAENLGVSPNRPGEAEVRIWGIPFRVIGVFAGDRLMGWADLDGEPITPVTFPNEATIALTEVEVDAMESGEDIQVFQSRYQHTPGDLTVFIPYRTLLAVGGSIKSFAVLPRKGYEIRQMAADLTERFGLILFAGEPKGTFLYHAGDTMQYSGLPNVVIPVLISILIVLNTMISSVYERKNEIAIYTSVGLAPSHVSFLFIAEAMAFAVISVVLGYLAAQVSAQLFSGTALWSGITVNYSSLAGVGAMVLVILVVLVSAIYPSRVAAEIAIPDVNRSWKMPEPQQSVIEVSLPFLMKYREQWSAGGFLLSHFEGHQDISHGLFSAGAPAVGLTPPPIANPELPAPEVPARPPEEDLAHLHIRVQVWMAPFDFGITQMVDLRFRYAEEPGFLAIDVRIERMAGEVNAWGRVNKAFINRLRKQMLMWRSLSTSERLDYENRLEAFRRKETA